MGGGSCFSLRRTFMTWNFGGGCGPSMSHRRSPNINGNVRDCVFSSLVFFSLLLSLFRREVGSWAATDCPDEQSEPYIHTLSIRDAWVQIAGQVRRDLVNVICQF